MWPLWRECITPNGQPEGRFVPSKCQACLLTNDSLQIWLCKDDAPSLPRLRHQATYRVAHRGSSTHVGRRRGSEVVASQRRSLLAALRAVPRTALAARQALREPALTTRRGGRPCGPRPTAGCVALGGRRLLPHTASTTAQLPACCSFCFAARHCPAHSPQPQPLRRPPRHLGLAGDCCNELRGGLRPHFDRLGEGVRQLLF